MVERLQPEVWGRKNCRISKEVVFLIVLSHYKASLQRKTTFIINNIRNINYLFNALPKNNLHSNFSCHIFAL